MHENNRAYRSHQCQDVLVTNSVRERHKSRTRRTIQKHALRLFLAQGYDATTVEQIATAAGVSHMTFFRYFPSKEDVVEDDDYEQLIADLVRGRPAVEGPLAAVHGALRTGLEHALAGDRAAVLARWRLIISTPALRARQWRDAATTESLLAAALAERAGVAVDLRSRVIAAAATAALITVITTWVERDGEDTLTALVDEAFDALSGLEPTT
jgi:AcrR family transcriptional regulator